MFNEISMELRVSMNNYIAQGNTIVITYPCTTLHYNMVGVAVAMVIPAMHEKSCIDLHNGR